MTKSNLTHLNVAFIASGGGTTFERAAVACLQGEVKNLHPEVLICTEKDAGCIERADRLGIPCVTIDYSQFGNDDDAFNFEVMKCLIEKKIDLVITAGCKRRIILNKDLSCILVFNTHPAEPKKHGGWHMYGVEVHAHVLRDIIDQLWRSQVKKGDRIVTVVTFHQILDGDYDKGPPLLQVSVPVPWKIINGLLGDLTVNQAMKKIRAGQYENEIQSAAEKLQQHVLQFEYRMLPAAINLAAHLVWLEREG